MMSSLHFSIFNSLVQYVFKSWYDTGSKLKTNKQTNLLFGGKK